jgi:hypothetical protein
MRAARSEWDGLIAQVPLGRFAEPGASGSWSARDVVAHLTEYDRWLALGLAIRLEKPPQLWLDDLGLDEFNAVLHERNRDRESVEVLAESKRVFEELFREVGARSEEFLFGIHRVEGVSYEVVPHQMLKSESYGHYRDHIPGLRAWLTTAMKAER